jgi:hypothetical protein
LLDVAILKVMGFSALGLLVIGWLAVSLQSPGRTQKLTARFASVAMYLALVCLFTHLTQENWAKGRAALYVPFGFLLAVFVSGFFLSLAKGVGELGSAKESSASATH